MIKLNYIKLKINLYKNIIECIIHTLLYIYIPDSFIRKSDNQVDTY